MIKRVHCVVTGRVQGVGFRYFTQEQAAGHGLNGWVRNLYDGSVELEAEGEEDILEKFLRRIKEGPSFGCVADMKTQSIPVKDDKDGFHITF
jgi:acylphosphatase